ncbi:MAG: Na(+)/H(+) antiporter subunit B [Desulfuromonadaceae bacterium]|nr:Na(+)/H(+) antiporter subunit B [Desulfuromonadaceae bacterium]
MRELQEEAKLRMPWQDVILQTSVRVLIPFIQLFGLYVVVHGHYSPGGGFQGGVILGSANILMALVFGLPASKHYISENVNKTLSITGPVVYCGIGALCVIFGGSFLDYGALNKILPLGPIAWRSFGIFLVELGVGIGVMSIMLRIYRVLSSAGTIDQGL